MVNAVSLHGAGANQRDAVLVSDWDQLDLNAMDS
jgi:hypothetical protein